MGLAEQQRSFRLTAPQRQIMSDSVTGTCVTVTDQAGKARKSCSDGLGRLTSVSEDPAVLNYQTTYAYDPLKQSYECVTGWFRTRSFTYNSLSKS